MFIVAHQDDDLLFQGAHLYEGLSNTMKTITVFVTAGNVDYPGATALAQVCSGLTGNAYRACIEQTYLEWRMAGSLAAYWDMALRKGLVSAADAPSGQPSTVAGATEIFQKSYCAIVPYGTSQRGAYQCSVGQAAVLIYLALSASQGINGSYPENVAGYVKGEGKTIEQLWKNEISALNVADDRLTTAGTTTYTRAQLIDVLSAVIVAYAPASVGTLDSTKTFYEVYHPEGSLHYGWSIDHSDHIYSAFFALEAERASLGLVSGVRSFSTYRTYNLSRDQRNLTCAEATHAANAMTAYGKWDWGSSYQMAVGDQCATLFASGGDYEKWTQRLSYATKVQLFTDAPIQGYGRLCLEPGAVANSCGSGSARWSYDSSGRLSTASGSSCLDASAPGLTAACTNPAIDAQKWTILGNGQIRGLSGRCLTISGASVSLSGCSELSSQPGSPLAIYAQRWTRRADDAVQSGIFSDHDGWASLDSYYRAARLGDVDGDGSDDLCGRGPAGVWCAISNNLGSFGSPSLWANAKFHDGSGWAASQYGATIQLGDVDGDEDADLCGRGVAGVWCALSDRTGFGDMVLWTSDFSDAQGWASSESYYRSIRLGDIDGDGDADLCGRGVSGMLCALSTGAGFAPASWWGSNLFSNASGWSDPKYGTTIQLGDLDGDGDADACARGEEGIHCAISDGARFGSSSIWTPDFSDSQGWAAGVHYYGSIRLADVDGDGRADVCGRGYWGVMCGASYGLRFDRTWNQWVTSEYEDGRGWVPPQYSTSMALGDINGDGRADLCGRGGAGVLCSLMP